MTLFTTYEGNNIVALKGGANTRDTFANTYQKSDFEGFFYRSAMLSRLKEEGKNQLKELKIEAVLDLRSSDEINGEGANQVPDGIEYFKLDQIVNPDKIIEDKADLRKDTDEVERYTAQEDPSVDRYLEEFKKGEQVMLTVYQEFVTKPDYQQRFALALQMISEYKVVLYNCAAGKDRTGFLSLLIHHIFGSSNSDIFRDYLISKIDYFEVQQLFQFSDNPAQGIVDSIYTVYPHYLMTALDTIKSEFNSINNYLDEIGIDSKVRDKIINLRKNI